LMAMLQVPLLGLRWRNIVDALALHDPPMTRADMIAATAVGVFSPRCCPALPARGYGPGCSFASAIIGAKPDRRGGRRAVGDGSAHCQPTGALCVLTAHLSGPQSQPRLMRIRPDHLCTWSGDGVDVKLVECSIDRFAQRVLSSNLGAPATTQ
jgi:hypothetical protein